MTSKRSTRTIAALAPLVLGAATLAACSPAGGDGGDVTLRYAIWDDNQRPAMEQIADAFEADHPGVTVDVQLTPNSQYWTTLQTAMSGGNGPDVFWMNAPRLPLYASEGQLAPLGDAVDAELYTDNLVDLYTYDDTLWGAPKDFDTVALWYNMRLFDEAGLAYPDETWTWDDVREAATALTDPATGTYGIVAPPYTQENVYTAIPEAGGFVVDEDETTSGYGEPEAVEAIQYWVDFIDSGASPTSQQMVDTLPEDMFGSGDIGMMYAASYMALPLSESAAAADLAVAELPAGPAGAQSVVHGLANVANANGANVELATEFAAFASGEQAAEIQASTGTVLPSVIGSQQGWVDAYPDIDAQVFVDMVDDATPYPVSLQRAEWGELESEILPQIWAGAVSVEDGLADLQERMQAVLDAEGDG